MRLPLIVIVLLAGSVARADDGTNYLVGPVLGYTFGGKTGGGASYGAEGGMGFGPERVNVGYAFRDQESFGYVELDPWFFVGGSLGVGVDDDGEAHAVLGAWEGLPILVGGCQTNPNEQRPAVTIAVGWRWTGVHELYATVKAGFSERICIDSH
ncbi:MAG TPA: hypothetical protein VL463_21890 [Kofleriaceae bacterium]|nr:hypothetical protein [Kofleriaceae bacterium]